MTLKQKFAWLALVLMVASVLPLSAISALPAQAAIAGSAVQADDAASALAGGTPREFYGVTVNGVPMTTDPMLTTQDGVLYGSLRSLSAALVSGVQINWANGIATVYKEGVLSLTAVPGQNYIVANGRYLPVEGGVFARNGAICVPLDTLVKAVDATYVWLADGTLALTTGSGGILSGDAFYNADDLYWLSRIIYAESGNQPLRGKIAVGNVVLNRVSNSRFPNTVYGVIFQRNQFSPVSNGTIKRTPNAESVLAAKLCLDGAVELENALYFNRVGLKSWASRNRTFVATIAQHSFYA